MPVSFGHWQLGVYHYDDSWNFLKVEPKIVIVILTTH